MIIYNSDQLANIYGLTYAAVIGSGESAKAADQAAREACENYKKYVSDQRSENKS